MFDYTGAIIGLLLLFLLGVELGIVLFYPLFHWIYFDIWYLKRWNPEKHFYLKYVKRVWWLQDETPEMNNIMELIEIGR